MVDEKMEILKFKGTLQRYNRADGHQGSVVVKKGDKEKHIFLPVFARTGSGAASAARRWRKVEGNLERLEKAFDENLYSVPPKARR